MTTLLKRTKDKSIPRYEAETQVEGDAALNDEGDEAELEDDVPFEKANMFGMFHMKFLNPENDHMFTNLFKEGQNPLVSADAHVGPIAPVPPANLVDTVIEGYLVDFDDDDKDSMESQ